MNEDYPSNWKHCTIHLNPETGEMHSDGDHSVREWIQSRIPDRGEIRKQLDDRPVAIEVGCEERIEEILDEVIPGEGSAWDKLRRDLLKHLEPICCPPAVTDREGFEKWWESNKMLLPWDGTQPHRVVKAAANAAWKAAVDAVEVGKCAECGGESGKHFLSCSAWDKIKESSSGE